MATSRPDPKPIHVFIASPGDLAVERRAFKGVIDELNGGFGDGAGVRFVALGWEDTLATTGRRAQGVINLDIDRSDVFVLALHRRWGQEAPDARPYTSYTEEEFHRAMDRWKKTGSPEIFVFFKYVGPGQIADAGPQLQKVLEFRKSLEDTRQVLYRVFDDDKAFTAEVDRHLRAYAKGELPKADAPREAVVLPLEHIQEVMKAKAEVQAAVERAEAHQQHAEAQAARADKLALELAEQAATAAGEGRVEQARQTFAKAHEGTTNLEVLFLAFEFYHRTGDLKAAEDMLEHWLAISGHGAETADTAAAYSNLGLIYQARGELDPAEEMLKKALAIDEKIGHQDGVADTYGNLGGIYQTRGELDRAEEILKKALVIHEKLGHQEGMASDYGNLGVIYQTRGELDRAEEMLKKALALDDKLGRPEAMANQYGNLGVIYQTRGELDRAEQMHTKSLAINEKLGRQKGMAANYGNLGAIYLTRRELDPAEEMIKKALAINEKLGRQEGMASAYGNLGLVYRTRGELDRAEEMHKKALAIDEKLGRQEGMASEYGNLGNIYETRGELDRAEEMYHKALALFKVVGAAAGDDQARVKLVPVPRKVNKRVFGQHRGYLHMGEDFDAPLPEDFWLGGHP